MAAHLSHACNREIADGNVVTGLRIVKLEFRRPCLLEKILMASKDEEYEIIFRPYIRKNGKIIRPKKGKVFPIRVRKRR